MTDKPTLEQSHAQVERFFAEHAGHDPTQCTTAMVEKLCRALAAAAVGEQEFNVGTWCRDNDIKSEGMVWSANLVTSALTHCGAIAMAHVGGQQGMLSAGTKQ